MSPIIQELTPLESETVVLKVFAVCVRACVHAGGV